LEEAGIAEAALDAWYLLEYVSGCTRSFYLAYPDKELDKTQEEELRAAVGKRAVHIPLQHITGCQEFMGLNFRVNDKVLVPRQDTEVLVEEVLKELKPGMRFLDLCTGSGCILLSLMNHCPGAEGTGADISAEALKVAEENRDRLNPGALLVQSDLFTNIEGEFDIIVSNPPYIRSGEIPGLMEEVRLHEPMLALDGHEDGLYFYRKISEESRSHLKKGGSLYFETGYDQGVSVPQIMAELGFCEIEVIKDLAGLDRVVRGKYPGI
jgi:release factor glutamine methyltransferase